MSDPAALRPPPEFQHLQWHWLETMGGLQPVLWSAWGRWSIGNMVHSPERATLFGWRYHGPCLPNAIVPDAEDEAMVEIVARALVQATAKADGGLPLCWNKIRAEEREIASQIARAALAALRKGAGG